jgi:hypothetical protein
MPLRGASGGHVAPVAFTKCLQLDVGRLGPTSKEEREWQSSADTYGHRCSVP